MDNCYICGSINNLTDDHIPPKNLFIKPLPKNLITVKCCNKCNNGFSMDDEAFRIFVSASIHRSKAGEWIWNNQVLGSSFKRSPLLKANVQKSLIPLKHNSITGSQEYGTLFPISRANNYLVRLTKGLIKYFHPELDYSKSIFKVEMINPTQQIVNNTLSKFIYDERGNGIFRFWRGFYSSDKAQSVWVYVFYDGLMFMVQVDP